MIDLEAETECWDSTSKTLLLDRDLLIPSLHDHVPPKVESGRTKHVVAMLVQKRMESHSIVPRTGRICIFEVYCVLVVMFLGLLRSQIGCQNPLGRNMDQTRWVRLRMRIALSRHRTVLAQLK